MKKALIIFLLCLGFPLFAEYNHLSIPDSSEIRAMLEESWFNASLTNVRNNKPEIYSSPDGTLFQVRLEETERDFCIFVSPHAIIKVDVYSDLGKYTMDQDVYPGDAAGSWELIKDKATGKAKFIRYFFLRDGDVYLQFSPGNNKSNSYADLVIFGHYAARGVSTGIPFNQFYTASFEKACEITRKILPWDFVEIDVNAYDGVKQMIGMIDEKLSSIIYTEDAMYDGEGNLVSIGNGKPLNIEDYDPALKYLSSAGFVKWISDGIVVPIAGSNLEREPLLEETVTVKDTGHLGVLSQKYSLYFALNWVRNLSSAVVSVSTGTTYKFNQSGVDVTDMPFSATMTSRGLENPVPFIADSGYKIEMLKSLMYVLGNKEKDSFYVGAIRETDRRSTPEVNVFNNCAAFFPYFDATGKFECVVYMNAKKMSLEEFMYLYSDSFVYLTRQKATERFFPE